MKNGRHSAILEIIEKEDIGTQEDMIARLSELGYDVTQATVSRDIRSLKLTKMLSDAGGYKYVVSPVAQIVQENNDDSDTPSNNNDGDDNASAGVPMIGFKHTVLDAITSIDYSGNIVVLKTHPGLAMAVASTVDSMCWENVLGCIGGDDTIMVVTRDESASADVCNIIREMLEQ